MPFVRSTDPDFRVAQISFETLVAMQRYAEERGWATRWSSVEALSLQVKEDKSILQPILREERAGEVRAYRCLVLFSTVVGSPAGGLATLDVDPKTYAALERVDRDPEVRSVLARMFALASGTIESVSKG
ncbi:hypothetical protein [Cellulosimicrobium sp. Marseille-Q8652]